MIGRFWIFAQSLLRAFSKSLVLSGFIGGMDVERSI